MFAAAEEDSTASREEVLATYVRGFGSAMRSIGRVLKTVKPSMIRNPALLRSTRTLKVAASRVRIASRAELKETVNTPEDPHAKSEFA